MRGRRSAAPCLPIAVADARAQLQRLLMVLMGCTCVDQPSRGRECEAAASLIAGADAAPKPSQSELEAAKMEAVLTDIEKRGTIRFD